MKKLIILSFIILSGFFANAQTDSAQFAQNILEAIKSGDIENIKKLVAPPAVYRSMFKTLEETDEELIAKTRDSEKLKNDFNNLLLKAKEKNVNLKNIQLDSITSAGIWKHSGTSWPFTIHFSIEGKKGQLAITAMQTIDTKQWYFLEFLMTINVFKEF
jgi:uncharacterized membrane protein YvbJ